MRSGEAGKAHPLRGWYASRMGRRVLIIDAHPADGTLVGALADAYAAGATAGGHETRRRALREMSFDPVLHEGYRERQELEPDLVAAQQDLAWCEHLVIAYPTWWGMPPALLKGFFDRALLPGFAFKYREGSRWWDRLLKGRSARLLVTMDAPALYDGLFYGGRRVVKRAVLRYCGFRPVRHKAFGPVRSSSPRKRERWLVEATALGRVAG